MSFMQSGEQEKPKIANDMEGHDSIQTFNEENILDERKIEFYKGYKKYGEWADRWLPHIWIGSIIVFAAIVLIEDRIYGPGSNTLTQPATFIALAIIAFPVLLGMASSVARFLSDITAEDVAYHELASAFQFYRQNPDNLDPVLDRISNSIKYFDSHRFKRLDSKRLDGVVRYLRKIDDAGDATYISDEFHSTFPTFMEELSVAVTSSTESSFSKLAKDMDSAYTGETSMKARLIKDMKRAFRFIFTGAELVVTLSLLVLVGSIHYMNTDVGTAFGIFGGMIGLYSIYQNRD